MTYNDGKTSTDDGTSDAPDNDLTMDDVIYWMGWHMDSQRRLYDVLLTLVHFEALKTQNPDLYGKAKELQELHEQGKFLYPPVYAQPDDGDRPPSGAHVST